MDSLLGDYFGPKCQYYDAEIEIIKQLDQIKEHDIKEYKIRSYLELERILNNVDLEDKINWYIKQLETISFNFKPNPTILNDIHENFKLSANIIREWLKVLLRGYAKQRTLVFYGKSNSGKSIIANALLYPFAPGMIQRAGSTNVHWLEAIYNKNFILWEEPTVNMTIIEDVKLLCGGENIVINRKNQNLIERLAGPSVLITTNKTFWNYRREELLNRCKIINFDRSFELKGIYSRLDFMYYIYYILINNINE